jgi:DNA-binding transcriptional ArsR family regulator
VSPRPDPAARLAALDEVVTALAHPARRQMLLTIHLRGEMSAGDVAARFSHAWPTTTRHLRVLEHAGLVRFERQGRRRVYRVEHARLGLVSEWLSWFDRPAAAVPALVRRAWGH